MLQNGQPVSKVNGLSVALTDYAGLGSHNTIFGEQTIGERTDYITIQFQYGISTRDTTSTVSGTGSTTSANSLAGVHTGAAIGSSEVRSKDVIRYRAGHEVVGMFTSAYNPVAGTNLKHGIRNGADGISFGYQGTTFGIWHNNGAVETFTPRSSWLGNKLDKTGDSDEYTLDPTKLNIYKIQFGYLGIAPLILSVYAGYSLGWVVVHWIDQTNSQVATHLKNPFLPISMVAERVVGSGLKISTDMVVEETGTDAWIKSASWRGGVVGSISEDNSSDRWFAKAYSVGSLSNGSNNLITLISKATFFGKQNHIRGQIGVITVAVDGNKTVTMYATKGGTLTGATVAADIDATNSVMQFRTGGSLAGGTRGQASVYLKTSQRRDDVRGTGFYIYPGESLTIEAVPDSAFTGTVAIAIRWIEEF